MHFPLFVNLQNTPILIVGGGQVATRRARVLSAFGDNLTLVSPEITPELELLEAQKKIRILHRSFLESDLERVKMVLAATNDQGLNEHIAMLCKSADILVNVSSSQQLCDFFFPSVVVEDDVVMGINASGQDHGKVKALRMRLDKESERTFYG